MLSHFQKSLSYDSSYKSSAWKGLPGTNAVAYSEQSNERPYLGFKGLQGL